MKKRIITRFIKNEENTARKPEIGDSWIQYWRIISRKSFMKCPICGCFLGLSDGILWKKAEGAHIRLLEDNRKWSDEVYIVPMCHECNCQFGEMLQVKSGCEDIIVVEEICKE